MYYLKALVKYIKNEKNKSIEDLQEQYKKDMGNVENLCIAIAEEELNLRTI